MRLVDVWTLIKLSVLITLAWVIILNRNMLILRYNGPTMKISHYERECTTVDKKYIINCNNLHKINITNKNVRHGRYKVIDLGEFNGRRVVVKRYRKVERRKKDQELRQHLFLNEILMMDQLNHPNLLKMLGYCIHRRDHRHDVFNLPLNVDITSVMEYGGEMMEVKSLNLSVKQRLAVSLEFADLLVYLENSPLGSLCIGDFEERHFLIANYTVKLIDFDYFFDVEPLCNSSTECPFDLPCRTKKVESVIDCGAHGICYVGQCIGFNAQENLRRVSDHFLLPLLNETFFPINFRHMISNVTFNLSNNNTEPMELFKALYDIYASYNLWNASYKA